MTHTIGMISLGCAKNQVNAEHMLWLLRQAGYEISPLGEVAERSEVGEGKLNVPAKPSQSPAATALPEREPSSMRNGAYRYRYAP